MERVIMAAFTKRPHAPFTLTLLAASTGSLAAQATIHGRVTMDPTGAPVAGAEVFVPQLAIATETDVDGRFELRLTRPGSHLVFASRDGYESGMRRIRLEEGDRAEVDFALEPSRRALEELIAGGREPMPDTPALRAFAARRESANGRFVSWAQLRLAEGRPLSDVLAGAGVQTSTDEAGRVRAVTLLERRACPAPVWFDGVLVGRGPFDPLDLRRIAVERLAAVEFYGAPADTPPAFRVAGSDCGALILWSQPGRTLASDR
jgi:hypothetical protein